MLFACSLTPSVVIPKAPRAHQRNLGNNILKCCCVWSVLSLSRILWSLWGTPRAFWTLLRCPHPGAVGRPMRRVCWGPRRGRWCPPHSRGLCPCSKEPPPWRTREGGNWLGLGLTEQEQGDEPSVLGRPLGQGRWAVPKLFNQLPPAMAGCGLLVWACLSHPVLEMYGALVGL